MATVATIEKSKILNFNVGVLGHIDSGKTSLGNLKLPSVLKLFAFCLLTFLLLSLIMLLIISSY